MRTRSNTLAMCWRGRRPEAVKLKTHWLFLHKRKGRPAYDAPLCFGPYLRRKRSTHPSQQTADGPGLHRWCCILFRQILGLQSLSSPTSAQFHHSNSQVFPGCFYFLQCFFEGPKVVSDHPFGGNRSRPYPWT